MTEQQGVVVVVDVVVHVAVALAVAGGDFAFVPRQRYLRGSDGAQLGVEPIREQRLGRKRFNRAERLGAPRCRPWPPVGRNRAIWEAH